MVLHLMAEEPLDVTCTSPEDWNYISEGGATIVLSYQGTYHSDLTGRVLRLPKARRSTSSVENPTSNTQDGYSHEADFPSESGQKRDVFSAKLFQDEVIAKYLSPRYLPGLRLASTNKDWLRRLSRVVESFRPSERREVDGIACEQQNRAFLATDLVGKDGLAIEIKVSLFSHFLPFSMPIKDLFYSLSGAFYLMDSI